jgi:FkbH-like protein
MDARPLAHRLETAKDAIVDGWLTNQFDTALLQRFGVPAVRANAEALRRSFLTPLLELFLAFLRTGEHRFRAVYLDERLRYAPHQADPGERAAFFRELLDRDRITLEERLPVDLRRTLEEIWTGLHASLTTEPDGAPTRLLAVGDCLLNEVRVFLPDRCSVLGIGLDMRCQYFSAAMGRDLASDDLLRTIRRMQPHLIAFSFLTYEGIPPYAMLLREADRLPARDEAARVDSVIGLIRRLLSAVRTETDATFLIHNACGLPLTRWRRRVPALPALSRGRRRVIARLNAELGELVANTTNAVMVDESAIVKAHGHRACGIEVIPRAIGEAANFHHARFGALLADQYAPIVRAYHDLHRTKVLCVDFDNTLWDGVMADGPVHQHLGRQRLVRELKNAGILLVSLSKNDPANVRWDEMTLTPDDFVLHKIGWQPKALSIQEAAQELDLGVDAFLVLDDSPAERALIAEALPMVRVLDSTSMDAWIALQLMQAFPNTRATAEARQRSELYRAHARRKETQGQALDYPAMLATLGLRAAFGPARRADLDRLTELVQRTNQFNTTTIRYSRSELESMLESPSHGVYVAELKDRFGALGLVAVAIVERRSDNTVVFDSFIMSCRAMGFGLEDAVLGLALQREGVERAAVGRFVPTARNSPAANLYERHGFFRADDGEWRLAADAARPTVPHWMAVDDRT